MKGERILVIEERDTCTQCWCECKVLSLAIMENSMEVSNNDWNKTTIWASFNFLSIYPKDSIFYYSNSCLIGVHYYSIHNR